MPDLILLNKPYGVICQFSEHDLHPTLSSLIQEPGFYPAGRLDTDSEGLLLLTNDGVLQHRITDPNHKLPKTYWVQVEGVPSQEALDQLARGVNLGDFITRPAKVRVIEAPNVWARKPPIRVRKHIPDTWLELTIEEGKNRQVRRMTAKVGHPTLRLVRARIGEWGLDELQPGQWKKISVELPKAARYQPPPQARREGRKPIFRKG